VLFERNFAVENFSRKTKKAGNLDQIPGANIDNQFGKTCADKHPVILPRLPSATKLDTENA